MRKYFFLLFLLLLLFTVTPLTAWAILPVEEIRPDRGGYIMPPYPPQPGQSDVYILGQNHSYSVLFRGNGEAIVTGRFIFSNLTDEGQSNYRLRIPQVQARDIIVYQQIRRGRCLNYRTPPFPETVLESKCAVYSTAQDCNSSDTLESEELPSAENSIMNGSLGCNWIPCAGRCLPRGIAKSVVCPQPECSNWEEPDYFNIYFGNNEYKKLQFTQIGDEIDIQLANPIQPQKTGSLLINYRAFGYGRKNILGGFNFTFETAKVPDKIYALQVGISVDSDLLLRQESGVINYYPQTSAGVYMEAPMMQKDAVSSSQLNDYYNQVGLGAVTKTATNLQPSESFSVKGSYADKSYKLYSREIFLGLAVILVILLLIYVCIKFLIKFYKKSVQKSQAAHNIGRPKKIAVNSGNFPYPQALPLIESLAVSFVSSFIIFGSVIFYFIVFPFIKYQIFVGPSGYNYYQIYPLQTLITIIIIICLALLDLVVFAGSLALIWKRRGCLWGIITVFLHIFWLVFYLLIVFLIFLLFSNRTNYYDFPTPVIPGPNPEVRQEMMKDIPTK